MTEPLRCRLFGHRSRWKVAEAGRMIARCIRPGCEAKKDCGPWQPPGNLEKPQ
jgi:hypothetical protein